MVQFQTASMDRYNFAAGEDEDKTNPLYVENLELESDNIEKPIIPINELGQTVPIVNPATGGEILQNVEGAIRRGASKMQLIWTQGHQSPLGASRPKSYGKEVRQAVREMAEANEVEITGFEMATSSMTNLSGFDPQRFTMSEEKRQRDIQEVKEAIDFAADVAGGGGVDIWSQEFARDITDADWNNNGSKHRFYDYSQQELKYKDRLKKWREGKDEKPEFDPRIEGVKYLYDDRTGQVLRDIRKSNIISVPKYMKAGEIKDVYKVNAIGQFSEEKAKKTGGNGKITENDFVDLTGNWLDPDKPDDQIRRVPKWDKKKTRFEAEQYDWAQIERMTDEFNKRNKEHINPEEMAFRLQLDNQVLQMRGQSLYYSQRYEMEKDGIIKTQKQRQEWEKEEERMKKVFKDDQKKYDNLKRKHAAKFIADWNIGGSPGELEYEAEMLAKDPNKYFDNKIHRLEHGIKHTHEAAGSADARAEEVLEMRRHVKTPEKLGLNNTTDSYAELGMHAFEQSQRPDVKKNLYVGPELGWPTMYGGHPKEFIKIIQESRDKLAKELHDHKGMTEERAKKVAKEHIKGTLDTSHLAMWFNHFEKKDNETEEQKLKRFNGWFMDQVKDLEKADVVGNIQAVDAITGQHSHLPAGQGVFPVKKAVEYMREKGWKGAIVSEGHEEDKFGANRILTETWREFGSPIGKGYFASPQGMGPHTWGGVQSAYFGATQPPTYIVGAYVPSNEWTLWSEVPFE